MKLTEEQKLKLDRAAGLLAEVQIQLLREDEQKPAGIRNEYWRGLYRVRCELAHEIQRWETRESWEVAPAKEIAADDSSND